MSLAILRPRTSTAGQHHFDVDIGTNRYYRYLIGTQPTGSPGLQLVPNPAYTSPLVGPLLDESLGRAVLAVPGQAFDRQNRYIQLVSYRSQKLDGPAVSDIVAILPSSLDIRAGAAQALSVERAMTRQPIETVAFAYRETNHISSAMFLGKLLKVATKVLPTVTKAAKKALPAITQVAAGAAPDLLTVAGNLLNSGTATNGAGNTLAGLLKAQLTGLAADPKMGQVLAGLLQPGPNGTTASPEMQALLQQLLQAAVAGQTASPAGTVSTAQGISEAFGLPTRSYAHEMALPAAAPALLEALPTLMPLLEKVITPETVKSLIDGVSPDKLVGTITNGLLDGFKELNRAELEQDKLTVGHLEKIMLQPDDTTIEMKMLEDMSSEMAVAKPALDYRRVRSVQLDFSGLKSQRLQGRSQVLYWQNQDIAFPLMLTTPRKIERGILHLEIKDPASLEVLLTQKYRVEQAQTGPLATLPGVSRSRLLGLPANEEYLVCLTLVWKNRAGQRIGTSRSQLMTLVGDTLFDQIDAAGAVIPLNDVERFRPYWHQIWQGDFSLKVRRIDFECKYYYSLEPARATNARMETLTQPQESRGRSMAARLKTGMVLCPSALNEVLAEISDYPQLDESELAALSSSEFKERFSHAAASKAAFQGDPGDSAALWVYPEFKIQPITLQQVARTDDKGLVTQLMEKNVYFPMPAVVHFIGTSTQT